MSKAFNNRIMKMGERIIVSFSARLRIRLRIKKS